MSAMQWASVVLVSLAVAGGVLGLLWPLARRREHWLVACLISAGLYVALSLRLEVLHVPHWVGGVRWGLLAVVGVCFWRYRRARRPASDS